MDRAASWVSKFPHCNLAQGHLGEQEIHSGDFHLYILPMNRNKEKSKDLANSLFAI